MNDNLLSASSSSSSSITSSTLPPLTSSSSSSTEVIFSTNDILYQIFVHLSSPELRTISLVNQAWNKVARDDTLWLQYINRKLQERNEVALPSVSSLSGPNIPIESRDRGGSFVDGLLADDGQNNHRRSSSSLSSSSSLPLVSPFLPLHRSLSNVSTPSSLLPPHKTYLHPPHYNNIPIRMDSSLTGYPVYQMYAHLPYYWPSQILPHYFDQLFINGHTLDGDLVSTRLETTHVPEPDNTNNNNTTSNNNNNNPSSTPVVSSTTAGISLSLPLGSQTTESKDKRKILSVRYIGQEEGDRAVIANAPFPHLYTSPKEKTKRRTLPFLWAPVCSTVPVPNETLVNSLSTTGSLVSSVTNSKTPPLSRALSSTSSNNTLRTNSSGTSVVATPVADLSHNFRRVLGAYIVAYYEVSILSYDPKGDAKSLRSASGTSSSAINDNWLHHEEKKACVAVGIATQEFPLSDRMPGWDPHSYGYHGDDGFKFHSSGVGKAYGPSFGAGDTVGCGIVYVGSGCGNGSSLQLRQNNDLSTVDTSNTDNASVEGRNTTRRRRLRRQDTVEHQQLPATTATVPTENTTAPSNAAPEYTVWQGKSFDEVGRDWPRDKGAIVFFTLNGSFLGPAFTNICCHESWYPCVGIDSPHPIRFNFGGTQPFCFDIRSFNNALLTNMDVLPLTLPNNFYVELMKNRRGKITSDSGLTMAPLPPSVTLSSSTLSSSLSSTTSPSLTVTKSLGNIFGGKPGSNLTSTHIFYPQLTGKTIENVSTTIGNPAKLLSIVAKAMQCATLDRLRIPYLSGKKTGQRTKNSLKRAITSDTEDRSEDSDNNDDEDKPYKRTGGKNVSGLSSSRSGNVGSPNTRSRLKYRRTTKNNEEYKEEDSKNTTTRSHTPSTTVRPSVSMTTTTNATSIPSGTTTTNNSRPPSRPRSRRNSHGLIGSIVILGASEPLNGPRDADTDDNDPAHPIRRHMMVQVNIPVSRRPQNGNDDDSDDTDHGMDHGMNPFPFLPFRRGQHRDESDNEDNDNGSTASSVERFSVPEYYPSNDPDNRPPRYHGRWNLRSEIPEGLPDPRFLFMLLQHAMNNMPNIPNRMGNRFANMFQGGGDDNNPQRRNFQRRPDSDNVSDTFPEFDMDDINPDDWEGMVVNEEHIHHGDEEDNNNDEDDDEAEPFHPFFHRRFTPEDDDDDDENHDNDDDEHNNIHEILFGGALRRNNRRSSDTDDLDNDDGNNEDEENDDTENNHRLPTTRPGNERIEIQDDHGIHNMLRADPFAQILLNPFLQMARMISEARPNPPVTEDDRLRNEFQQFLRGHNIIPDDDDDDDSNGNGQDDNE